MTLLSRDFKGIWIPREIWVAPDLSVIEKALWAEIHSLYDRKRGGCFASNKYLSDFIGCEDRNLQKMIAKLKDKGFLEYKLVNGNSRILKAIIPPEEDETPLSIRTPPPVQKDTPPCTSGHPLYIENKDKNKEREQQQPMKLAEKGAVAPAAVVFDCLKELGIPQHDKLRICKTYDEATVKQAVAYCLHPETKIKTSLVQVLQWACKEKPALPIDKVALVDENRMLALEVESRVIPGTSAIICRNDSVEVYYKVSNIVPKCISYVESQFKDIFKQALWDFGVKVMPRNGVAIK